MTKGLQISLLIGGLLIGFGVLSHFALNDHCNRTFADQEAFSLYMQNGITLKKEMENRICLMPFLMIIAGIAVSGFTFAHTVELRAPVFGKAIRYLVIAVGILYFGAAFVLMIVG